MATILCIETATPVCSAALAVNGKTVAWRETDVDKSHAAMLSPFILELLDEQQILASQVDAVAVSRGPGSYTGLRIGVSEAKGIAFGSGIHLIAIDTLEAMAMGARADGSLFTPGLISNNPLLVPMIDARRMEVYTAIYDMTGRSVEQTKALVVDENSFTKLLERQKLVFIGNGVAKIKDLIKHPNAIFLDGFQASARHLVQLADNAYQNKEFEDIAYFEPSYLKDFIATIPKKNIFN